MLKNQFKLYPRQYKDRQSHQKKIRIVWLAFKVSIKKGFNHKLHATWTFTRYYSSEKLSLAVTMLDCRPWLVSEIFGWLLLYFDSVAFAQNLRCAGRICLPHDYNQLERPDTEGTVRNQTRLSLFHQCLWLLNGFLRLMLKLIWRSFNCSKSMISSLQSAFPCISTPDGMNQDWFCDTMTVPMALPKSRLTWNSWRTFGSRTFTSTTWSLSSRWKYSQSLPVLDDIDVNQLTGLIQVWSYI